ncbi:MAG: PAS domain S-box protein [Thermoplasmata archaeon]|nr:MAG: PAS domain S-box protein [Thermoplasmata archaeon]
MNRELELMDNILNEVILSESAGKIYGSILSLMKEMPDFDECAVYVMRDEALNGNPDGIISFNQDAPEVVSKSAEEGKEICGIDEIAVPVIVGEEVAGVLYARSAEPDNKKSILKTVANLAAASIKNLEIKKEMAQSEKKYRSIIENAVEGIYMSTLDGRIIEANSSLVKFFGYNSKEELKEAGIPTTYRNPEERKEFIGRILREKKVKNYEIEYRRKNGELAIGNEFAVLAENGEKVIQGIIHDVTELKKIQREVEFYNALLRHDMWNKNQVVMGYLELLSDTGLSEEQRNFVERAKLAVKNNMVLIDNVKKLFTMGQRAAEQVDVDETIEDIINQLLHEADKRGISIYYTPSGIKIDGIPLIKEVFYNILLNAIFHSHCRNIRIGARRDKNFCRITIEDDGIGISPEIQKDIFMRKVEKSRRNGLGLYLSGKIVEMGGGSIEVKNRVEGGNIKGTIFEVSVPIQNDFKR